MKRLKSRRVWLIALLAYFTNSTMAMAYTVELTREQVQAAVERHFPLEHTTPYATITLYRPMVFLEHASNRIGLELTLLADVPGVVAGKGRGAVDGDLEYRQETGEFYLHDPKIKRLDLEDFPPDVAASVQQTVQGLMRQSLPVILVYKLRDEDIGQRLTKQILSSVSVKNGKLILELTTPAGNATER